MKRTGVIVGFTSATSPDYLRELLEILNRRFPGVTFCVANGASSVAFEWEDDQP